MSDGSDGIRRTIALYAQLLDDQRWTDLAGLFTADGELPWGGRTLTGRDAIADGLPATQPPAAGGIKHFVFPPVIDVDGDTAWAWSDVIVALVQPDHSAALSFVGRYHDQLRREETTWRIRRHITVATGEPVPDGIPEPPSH